jgi:RsiW-degrading membrane proteinase PrsW (M82 family)
MLLFLAALLPTLIYLALFWWLDKYEKEPWGLFLAAFLYGCIPAVIMAIIVELAIGGGQFFAMAIVAPIVEELVKGFAVLLVFLIWRREFDGILDGILYGAVVGLGFAMVENFFYFLQGAEEGGVLVLILLRALAFGLNHAFFTAFTGASLGLARQSRWRGAWVLYSTTPVSAARPARGWGSPL